ncbi:MAG: uncharacterized protein KVP18_003618 [Porospora cf. gigantea A]|uniref:uncharacterized protein n=2 Tax=Porospora cf. gigantea A TaxID=2853593 RepID=UPI00355A3EFB|nr:MAG: hypothetical protein KVP18_003618 [Porospora cf. gigantea A]
MSSPQQPQALSVGNIRHGAHRTGGHFRMSRDLFGWKNNETKKVHQFELNNVRKVTWCRVTKTQFALSWHFKDGSVEIFSGFEERDFERLKGHLARTADLVLEPIKKSTRGWSWGEYTFSDEWFTMNVDDSPSLFFPCSSITDIAQNSKTEVTVQFQTEKASKDDSIIEMRFYVPPARGEQEDEADPMETFKSLLLQNSKTSDVASEVIATHTYGQLVSPPGRFDVQITKTGLRLHGKSANFNVQWSSMQTMYALPTSGTVYTVLALDTPLRKGLTKYQHIVLQLDDRKKIEVELQLEAEDLEELKSRESEIEPVMSGFEAEVFNTIIMAVSRLPVIQPERLFLSASGQQHIRAACKATNGCLFFLRDSILFVPKPIHIVRYDEIASVEFGRTGGNQTRLFEFRVGLKKGEIEFASVDRQEYNNVLELFTRMNVRVRNAAGDEMAAGPTRDAKEDQTESDDEDFNAEEEEESSDDTDLVDDE